MNAESLPRSAILGYGLGDAANNIGWQMTNLFLTTYYLYLGMDPMLVADIFLGAHLFQALVYLVAGRITDGRAKDREGGLRRLVVVFGLPMMISVTLMYTIPAGAPMPVRIGWAIATYLLYQLLGALGGVPYGALLGAMTRDSDDRQRLAASRTFGGAAAGVVLTFTLAPRVNDMDPSRLFLPVVAACCLLGSLGYLIMARTTRERYLPPAAPPTSLKEDLRLLADNRPLLVVCLATLFMTNPVASLAPIVAKEVLTVGNPGLTGRVTFALTLVGVLAGVVVAPCSPWLVQRLGKRGTWTLGGLMVIGSSLAFILVQSAWPAVACIALNGIGVQVITPCIWAMQADSVQYEQWRTGNGNTAGTSMAALSITRQVGAAINGWAGPAILSFLGYRPGMNVAQDPALGANMRLAVGLVPAVMFTISVLLIRCYPLTEEVFGRISADLQAGRIQCQCSHIRQGTEHQACPGDPRSPHRGGKGTGACA